MQRDRKHSILLSEKPDDFDTSSMRNEMCNTRKIQLLLNTDLMLPRYSVNWYFMI